MRKIIVVLTILLMIGGWQRVALAGIARGGGGARPAVGNRSGGRAGGNINRGNVNRANINRGNVNRGNINRGNVNGANINRGNVNRSNINRGNVNGANINRSNVNRSNINGNVNRNVNTANINRTANVNGWGNHYWTDDNHWGWGSFAGGAAAAATGAAVGAAVANHNDVESAPPAGTVVTSIPAGCSTDPNAQSAMYTCGDASYQPAFDGSNLVYQVVPQ